jgi:uncharacterized protein (DUF58 family)
LIEPRPGGPAPTGARATEALEVEPGGNDDGAATISRDPSTGRYAWILGGLLLAIIGGAVGSDPIAVLGIVLAGIGIVRWINHSRGLGGLIVIRRLARDRVICGDPVELLITVRNQDPLPVPWLRVAEALPLRLELASPGDDASLAGSGARITAKSELRNGWSLAPYRRITRRIQLVAGHRGVHRFDVVHVSAGDLLGRTLGDEDRSMPVTLVVRPRLVATEALDARHDWNGERPTRTGRVDDPSRFAGVRPYTPGDSVRRIHWRATARLGEPVVKRFDPARERDVVIVLDVDTQPADQATPRGSDIEAEHDRFEELCIVAASLARRFEADGAACGLAAANFTGGRRIAFAAPSSAAGQSGRLGDLLARLGDDPSAPFPALLSGMTRLARPGTQLVMVSARDPRPSLAAARGLARSGFGIELVALGEAGPAHARVARGVGIPARAVRLDGGWRASRALELVG